VEAIRVPGNHLTMLDEPQVGVLAAEITKALARCSAHPVQKETSQGSDSAFSLPSPRHSTLVTSNATFFGLGEHPDQHDRDDRSALHPTFNHEAGS
jgi:hypothetical protein